MNKKLRELMDEVEILEMQSQANRWLDDGNLDAYCNCFTEDGVFHTINAPAATGRAEIKAFMEQIPPGIIHMTVAHVVEVNGDEAYVESSQINAWAAMDGLDSGFLTSGRTQDHLVRTHDGWRYRKKMASPDMAATSLFISSVFARLLNDVAARDGSEMRRQRAGTRWQDEWTS